MVLRASVLTLLCGGVLVVCGGLCRPPALQQLVVVDFHATWCGPCKMIAPKIEVLAKEHGNVHFFKVDVDELEVSNKYCAARCLSCGTAPSPHTGRGGLQPALFIVMYYFYFILFIYFYLYMTTRGGC